MIEKIISGGQIGVDIAGLRAAKKLGIETGGWMPKDYLTLDGQHSEYAQEFGMRETSSPEYPPRTFKNVEEADVTIRIAYNFDSPGERCTLKAIRKFDKRYHDVLIKEHRLHPHHSYLSIWLDRIDAKVVNIAGNANKSIEADVEEYLIRCLTPLIPLKQS